MSNQEPFYDVIVVGGGPSGATAANLLARKGRSVLLLERERFPRFQIGESLLPYNNDIFRKLGLWDEMMSAGFYPKYGAEFLTGDGSLRYTFRFNTNLPEKYCRSFQVKRAKFDEVLLRAAAKSGADVREGHTVTDVDLSEEIAEVTATAGGQKSRFRGRFVLDASGTGALLGRKVGEREEDPTLRKVAIFAHYDGLTPSAPGVDSGNTVIAVMKNAWFWLIPLSEQTTSVGIVVDRDLIKDSATSPADLLDRAIAASPYVAERMKDATRVSQVYTRKDFSFRMKRMFGENFALAGDAAGFIDPIFSTGVFIAMKTADMLAEAIDQRLSTGSMAAFRKYEKRLASALDRYHHFIEQFYRPEFLEIFLQPSNRFGLIRPVVGVLAGDIFERSLRRWKLKLFFALVDIQRRRRIIAPPIDWDMLPAITVS